MSPTSVESPPGAAPTNGHPANGSTTTEKPSFLRSAISMGDVSSVKTNGMDRIWRSGIQVAEEKATGEDGQKVVVAAWLKHALTPDETAAIPLEDVYQSFAQVFPLPPNIPAPTTSAEMAAHIERALPESLMRNEATATTATTTVKAKLQPLDFDKSADIWAQAGYDLTMWVLQYVQSQLSSHKRKADKLEPNAASETHGLVGTGVSLTAEGLDKPTAEAMVKVEEPEKPKTENPSVDAKPTRVGTKTVGADKIPDSAYTLLSTAGMPFPQLSIRKNFRTMITASAVHTIVPPVIQSTDGEQKTSTQPAVKEEEKAQEILQRQVNIGRYCPQVLGHEGSVRITKSWLHAWLAPSTPQKVTSVNAAVNSTTSRRASKDSALSKQAAPTLLTPLSDIYIIYTNYAFHPPRCPLLDYEDFMRVIRGDEEKPRTEPPLEDEPVWTLPCPLILRQDISLEAPPETPVKSKSGKQPKQETPYLVQASFRFDPNPSMDAAAYLDAGNSLDGAPTATRGPHHKEHDLVWRSVGLNFSRWVKAERTKRRPKPDASAAAEAERASKRRKVEEGAAAFGGARPMSASVALQRPPYDPRPSVMLPSVVPPTSEQRRRQIMATWLNENYARHSDPNLRIEQKVLWAAFLSQVVRRLPPWESEIFTYMRPNELFALTTEIWGTRLAAESLPADASGMQRHSFWICGIVARPPKTTFKTHAIQPRNPLMQQAFPQEQHTAHSTAPYPPAYLPPQPQTALARPHEQQRSNDPSSARYYPSVAHSSSQTPYTGSTAAYHSTASRPVPFDQRHGPLPNTASTTSLNGYTVSGRPSMNESPAYRAHASIPNHSTIPSHAQTLSAAKSVSYSMSTPAPPPIPGPSTVNSRPILPPPPSLTTECARPSVDQASSEKVASIPPQQPAHNSAQDPRAVPNVQPPTQH